VSISSLFLTTVGKSSEFSASLAGRDASMADMWAHMFGPRDIVVKESNPRLDAEPAVSIEYVEPS